MSHCPGCGGHVTSAPPSYGHIIGCGFPGPLKEHQYKEPVPDWGSPWTMDRQTEVLQQALKEFLGREPTKDQVDKLGRALQKAILKPKGPSRRVVGVHYELK